MSRPSAIAGFLWKILEQLGLIGVQFLLQIVLARILTPADYGEIAIVAIFISFANIFVQCGLSTALVQKKELDGVEVSSIFNYSILVGLGLYILIFISASYVGHFFEMERLPSLLRVMSLTIFPGLFNAIQVALLRRELRFKTIFFSSITSVVLSGTTGVILAFKGFGAWALVWQVITYNVFVCLTLFIGVRWLPKPIMQVNRIKPLISYGWKILLSNLIDDVCLNIRSFVIGKKFSGADLAFFNRGKSFPDLLVKSINGSLQAVLLPVLSSEQDNNPKIRELIKRTISISTFTIFPMLVILAGSAATLIPLLLTDKWLSAVFYLQIFCLYYMSWPITTSNIQAMYAKGLSGLVLKLETARKIIDLIILFISIYFGMIGIAWGTAIVSVLSIPLYLFPAKKILNYSIFDQLKDIIPNFILSIAIGILVFMMNYLPINLFLRLGCQILGGLLIYWLCAYLLNMRAYGYFTVYMESLLKRKFSHDKID